LINIASLDCLLQILLQCLPFTIFCLLQVEITDLIITDKSKVLEMFVLMHNFTQQLICLFVLNFDIA